MLSPAVPMSVSRRRLLQLSGASAAAIALGIDAPQAQAEAPPVKEGPVRARGRQRCAPPGRCGAVDAAGP